MSKKVFCFLLFLLTVSLLSVSLLASPSYAMPESPTVVFLGDSTTNSLYHHGILQKLPFRARVWTGAGNTLSMWDVAKKKIHITKEIEADIRTKPNAPKIKLNYTTDKTSGERFLDLETLTAYLRPDCIVITLGINGCSLMSDEDFIAEYRALVDTLKAASPDTQLVLHSILPVAERAKVTNARIDEANRMIRAIAESYGLPYLDTNSLLKTESGFPDPSLLDASDGIHWNKKGCQKIWEVMWYACEQLAKTPLPLAR